MPFFKKRTYRSKKYLEWIRSEDNVCAMCDIGGYENNPLVAHHAISIPGLQLGMMGGKSSDTFCIPLHASCHVEFHLHFDKYKWEQPIWLMKTLERFARKSLG